MATQTPTDTRRSRLLEFVRQCGFAHCPTWLTSCTFRSRRFGVIWTSWKRTVRPSGRLAARFTRGRPRSCPTLIGGRRCSWEQKRQIALAAATLIEEGDTILLDGGTTTYELARLAGGAGFAGRDEFAAGGEFVYGQRPIGPGADRWLCPHANRRFPGAVCQRDGWPNLNVRRAVLSVSGITHKGYYNSNLLLVETEQAMMAAADEVIVVADSSKFGHASLALLCGLSDVDVLVVDRAVTDRVAGAAGGRRSTCHCGRR